MSSITSIAQPGHRVPDDQLLPELPGSLMDLREMDGSRREFTELFIGIWQQPDGSKTAVAVKRFKNIQEDTDRFGAVTFHLNPNNHPGESLIYHISRGSRSKPQSGEM